MTLDEWRTLYGRTTPVLAPSRDWTDWGSNENPDDAERARRRSF